MRAKRANGRERGLPARMPAAFPRSAPGAAGGFRHMRFAHAGEDAGAPRGASTPTGRQISNAIALGVRRPRVDIRGGVAKASACHARHRSPDGRESASDGVSAPVDIVVRGAVPRSGAAACVAAPGRARRPWTPWRPWRPWRSWRRALRPRIRGSLPAGGYALDRPAFGAVRAGLRTRPAARRSHAGARGGVQPGSSTADTGAAASPHLTRHSCDARAGRPSGAVSLRARSVMTVPQGRTR